MSDSSTATVCLYGKGFEVSERSPEFQRLVPVDSAELQGLETSINEFASWPTVLSGLYDLSEQQLSIERAVLIDEFSTSCVCVAPHKDRHGRPSVLVLTATASLDWNADDVGEVVGKVHRLASRLVRAFARELQSDPERTGRQLRAGHFLPDRSFQLVDEDSADPPSWMRIFREVLRWKGIRGVASPSMIGLGANVLLGTRFEAEKLVGRAELDAYFDSREGRIVPITPRLELWANRPEPGLESETSEPIPREPELDRPSAAGPVPPPERIPPLAWSAYMMGYAAMQMAEVAVRLGEQAAEYWFAPRRRGKDKKK